MINGSYAYDWLYLGKELIGRVLSVAPTEIVAPKNVIFPRYMKIRGGGAEIKAPQFCRLKY